MTTATAAVVTKAGGPFELCEIELDDLRPDEVRVRMVATGICHTDISAAHGIIPFPLPGVLGHEGAGVVEEVGERVQRARPGDRVLLSFTSCGRCQACRGGHPAYCAQHLSLNLLGGRRADGSATVSLAGQDLNAHFFGQSSFSTQAVVSERSLVVVPEGTSDAELTTLAPLGCGFMTGAGAVLNVLRPTPGAVLAISGAGAVGLAAVMASRLTGATQVIVVDRVVSRLDIARQLGASDVVDTSDRGVQESLLSLTDGRGVDFAVETTGNVAVLDALIESLAVRGTCAVVGAPAGGSRGSFEVNKFLPGRAVAGVTMGDSEPETFIPLLAQTFRDGRFPIDRLERTYPFSQINEAVADAASGATIKPILTF